MDATSTTPTQTDAPKPDALMEKALSLNRAYNEKRDAVAAAASGRDVVAPVAGEAPVVKKDDGVPRGEGGKFEKKPETIEKETNAKRERAIQGLRRAGFDDEALDSLSPDKVLSLGTKFADKQAVQDGKSSELGKKAKESRAAEPVRAGQPQNAADNLPAIDAKALADQLALDEDEKKGIEGWAKSVVKPYEAQLAAATEAAEKATTERYDIGRRLGIALNAALYPEVATYRDQIEAKYDEYAESGAYEQYDPEEGVRLCARDAIEFVCKPAIDLRRRSESESRSKGQPSAGSRQGDGALKQADPMLRMAQFLNANPGKWQEAGRLSGG